MILYEVRYDEGDGTNVEWFRNKARAEKRKRELSRTTSLWSSTDEDLTPTYVEDIVQHTVEPNKDAFVRFLNNRANRDNG